MALDRRELACVYRNRQKFTRKRVSFSSCTVREDVELLFSVSQLVRHFLVSWSIRERQADKEKERKRDGNRDREYAVLIFFYHVITFDKNTAANWRFTSVINCNALPTLSDGIVGLGERTRGEESKEKRIKIFQLCWFTAMIHSSMRVIRCIEKRYLHTW